MLVSALLLKHLIVRQKRVWSEPQNKWWLETSLDAAVQEESPELLERERWRMQMKRLNVNFLVMVITILILKSTVLRDFSDVLPTMTVLLQFKSMILRDAKIRQF